jgi:para-nitrobenzyl esterase
MPQQKYPVYIWIHGGGYQTGSGGMGYQEIFKAFTSTGIIVVSINYRLNVFGETWKFVSRFNLTESVS